MSAELRDVLRRGSQHTTAGNKKLKRWRNTESWVKQHSSLTALSEHPQTEHTGHLPSPARPPRSSLGGSAAA